MKPKDMFLVHFGDDEPAKYVTDTLSVKGLVFAGDTTPEQFLLRAKQLHQNTFITAKDEKHKDKLRRVIKGEDKVGEPGKRGYTIACFTIDKGLVIIPTRDREFFSSLSPRAGARGSRAQKEAGMEVSIPWEKAKVMYFPDSLKK